MGKTFSIVGFVWLGVIAFNLAFWWVIASAITSGIKTASNQCNETYQIESVVNGNFFCK